ncbi:MAG: carboxypeptidase regulatory-like domain-containing protein [Proteobacteria bacterium]|jgi:hypothetical protein|nr:carboxypeptidase regulatory-like domain-containing protein [Pseudomonadota bacterium]
MKKLLSVITLMMSIPLVAHTAGYLEFDDQGYPFKWDNTAAPEYRLDLGNLGPISKMDADSLVADSFSAWAAIGGLTFGNGGNAPQDVTVSNLSSNVDFNGNNCFVPDFLAVYDETGGIFQSLFGSDAGNILGIASPSVLSISQRKITCGYALMNGAAISDDGPASQNAMLYIMMHEFGHGQNLSHTQINGELNNDSNNDNDAYIPLMYPIIPSDSIATALMGGIGGIKLDDQFSFLTLYNPSVLNGQGRIRGNVRKKNGDGVLGANVVCYDKNNPLENAVSWVSDASLTGNGEYTCGRLPAGDYQVRIEPITVAINSWEQGVPPYIPTEFYNGENESFSAEIDSLNAKTDITVGTSTVTGINLFINDNGMITSEKKVSGTVPPGSPSDLEYFIYVPKSVKKATFTLESNPVSADVDLYGKCNQPFSMALATAGPLYNPNSPANQQAEFAGAGATGNETITLSTSSSPKIDNCEYHLILANYSGTSVDFDLTVKLEGNTPRLRANFDPQRKVQDDGSTLVSKVVFEAQDDQFSISSAKFTDSGLVSMSGITSARIYADSNNNGKVDAADELLSSTSDINVSSRTFTFNNMNLFIDEGAEKNLLITYQIPASASSSLPLALALVAFALMVVFGSSKVKYSVSVVMLALILARCSGSGDSDFNPGISASTDLTAQASGFGEKFDVQVGKPKSVKEFFE